ncbi:MAG TPA: nuclear transport factor 2 family protein [Acidimicrobiales bacterium]|jgi:limonene-1,2-epoxide hydrolase|nr:nuclear transport factor 2 family protein [Acidimicrobiales bacterium]
MGAVEDYLKALSDRDWAALPAVFSESGLSRSGPFADMIEGRDAYVEFLREVCSPFPSYRLDTHRISRSGDRIVFAEIDEVVGGVGSFPEVLLFELDESGKIRYVSVFMKHPGGQPSVAAGRAG